MKWLRLLLLLVFLTGCSAPPDHQPPKEILDEQWESSAAKFLIPVNLTLSYFGAMSTHESGHALTAEAYNSKSLKINILPSTEDGVFHMARTNYTFVDPIGATQDSLLNIAGPSAAFAGQISSRELLKTGWVPLSLQPSLQWYSVGCKVQFYTEVLSGLYRNKNSDLGKEQAWVPITMGLCGLLYDIWDLGFCDNPDRYFKVLVGDNFYYSKREQRTWVAYFNSSKDGAGFSIAWKF